jgi:hypothetical protein
MGAIGQNALGLPLENSNDVDGVGVALILILLGFGKLAFIARFRQLVNSCLNVRIGPNLDDLSCVIQGHRVAEWIEETVDEGRG